MVNTIKQFTFVSLLTVAGLTAFAPGILAGRERSSPIRVSVEMDREIFYGNEPVKGEIILDNRSGATLTATFRVRLFHEDRLIEDLSTRIGAVLPGPNKYRLHEFGIPPVGGYPGNEGPWTLLILQNDLDESYLARATFTIAPLSEKPEENRYDHIFPSEEKNASFDSEDR